MKGLIMFAVFGFIGCVTTGTETVIRAKTGVVMCPQLGVISFKGDAKLNGDWVVFTPTDHRRIKEVAASGCTVTVLSK